MTAFPLTKLPLVNLIEVMRMMDVSELLRLTSCTKQVQQLARRMKQIKLFSALPCSQKEPINVLDIFGLFQIQLMNGFPEFLQTNPLLFNLVISNNIGIEINLKVEKNLKWYLFVHFSGEKPRFKEQGEDNHFIVDNQLIPCISSRMKKELYIFWEDKTAGMLTLVTWIRRTFNIQFETMLISAGDQPGYSNEFRSIVNHVKELQSLYTNVIIDERKRFLEDNDLEFIMRNVTGCKKYYHLGIRTTPISYRQKVETDKLLICPAHWFTFQHLLLTNCVFINVVDSTVSDDDLTTFVANTLNGSFPRLKHVTLKQPNISVANILLCGGNRRGYIRDGIYISTNNKTLPIRIGAVVEHDSETRAVTVTFPQRKRLMTFEMFVWPDIGGNYFNNRNEIRPFGF